MNPNEEKKPEALMIAIGEKKDKPMDNSYNKIELGQLMPDVKEGEEIDATIHGKVIMKPDGSRCISVMEIDGQPIGSQEEESPAEDMNETPEEEASEGDDMNSAKANLMNSIRAKGGYNNAEPEA